MKNYVQLNTIVVYFTRIDIVLLKYEALYFTYPPPQKKITTNEQKNNIIFVHDLFAVLFDFLSPSG